MSEVLAYDDTKRPDRIPGESGWDWCKRAAAAIPPEKLVALLLRYIHKRMSKKRLGNPLWSYVGDATGHGSGVSAAIVAHYCPEIEEP